MNQNQFEQIARRMKQRFGSMEKGQEEPYVMLLFSMEGNLLQVHRSHPAANGRRCREALFLALYVVQERTGGKAVDVKKFENPENLLLRDALLSAFDPQTNPQIAESLAEGFGEDWRERWDPEVEYEMPVRCILWILKSVELWTKRRGPDGYFEMLEQMMGSKVKPGADLHYAVAFHGVRETDPAMKELDGRKS